MYSIIPYANSDSFTPFSPPIWIPFILWFPWLRLQQLLKKKKKLLKFYEKKKKWVNGGQPCLVPDLRGNSFSLSLLRMMLPTYMTFIMLRHAPSKPTFWRVVIIIGCWDLSFVKSFFYIFWDDHIFLFFNLLICCITLLCRYWKILVFLR